MRKKILVLPLFPLLLLSSCGERKLFPFGETPDISKDFVVFRQAYQNADAVDYSSLLPTIDYEKSVASLENDESLSLFLWKKGCSACEDLFETYKELNSELGIETWGIDPSDAEKIAKHFSLDTGNFGKGTPSWYLVSKDKVSEVLYGTKKNKESLKNQVKSNLSEWASAYNAYRYIDIDSFMASEQALTTSFYLERDDASSLSFYKECVVPFLAKNQKEFYILDSSFLSEEDKAKAVETLFSANGEKKFLRYQGNLYSGEEAKEKLDEYLK